MSALVLFGSLVLFLLIGVPIGICLGSAALLSFAYLDIPMLGAAQKVFTALDSTSLMAIPFFVLAGNLMTKGGISKRLSEFANSIIGNVRGGMGIAVVIACAFFAALSGSGSATVIAIGSMFYPEMIKIGYTEERASGLICISGGLGPIIPPSIAMVIYATCVNASVSEMFTAGTVVGILIAVALVIVCLIFAHKEKWPKNEKRIVIKELGLSFAHAIPALFLPVIILGGIFSGLLTPTESAAVAVAYALIISIMVYKEIKLNDLKEIFFDSARATATVMFIIAASSVFGWIFTSAGLSDQVVSFIQGFNLSPLLFLFLFAVVLLIFGLFMEGAATILLLVPMLWPIASALGIHAVHFGMVIIVAIVIGNMTPPVALNIFATATVTKLSIERIAKGQMPFFITMCAVFVAVILFPQISLAFL